VVTAVVGVGGGRGGLVAALFAVFDDDLFIILSKCNCFGSSIEIENKNKIKNE